MRSLDRYERLTRLYALRETVAAGHFARATRALAEVDAQREQALARAAQAQDAVRHAAAAAGCVTLAQLQRQRRRIAIHLAQRAEAYLDVETAEDAQAPARTEVDLAQRARALAQRKLDKWRRAAHQERRALSRRRERAQATAIEEDSIWTARKLGA